ALADLNASDQLMQLLMSLGDTYDRMRSQVLLMDPLPTIGKAYSLFLRVEMHREVYASPLQDGVVIAKFLDSG
ncbi:UNVERIFIED_CONTAM: hypothetical protein Sindi_2695600, partial [Sesamum indicum]